MHKKMSMMDSSGSRSMLMMIYMSKSMMMNMMMSMMVTMSMINMMMYID